MQSRQFRIRVESDDAKVMESLASGSGLEFTDIGKMLIHAAIQAIKEREGRFQFPPKFYIDEVSTDYQLNETPKKK